MNGTEKYKNIVSYLIDLLYEVLAKNDKSWPYVTAIMTGHTCTEKLGIKKKKN